MNEDEVKMQWIPENVPSHLRPIYVDALLRHGTRFPSIKRVKIWKGIIPKVQQYIVQSDSSLFSSGFKNAVLNWTCPFTDHSSNLLSSLGWKEHVTLGQKYHSMMPDLWAEILSDRKGSEISSLLVSSSRKIRARASARAFVTSLQHAPDENHPELVFDEGKVLKENNVLDPDTNSTWYGKINVKVDDSNMRYFDNCSKYLFSVDYNESADHEFEKFLDTRTFSGLITRIPDYTSPKEIFYVHQLCAFESAIYGQSIWCKLFSDDDLVKLEYAADLKHYYKTGSGYEINFKQSCVLLKSIMEHMNASLTGKAEKPFAVLRFGHAETLIPLMTLLEFYRDPMPLKSDNYEKQKDRLFRTGRISPFSGNLALLIYEDEHKAKFMAVVINEVIVKPFNMNCYFCPYGPESEIFKHLTAERESG